MERERDAVCHVQCAGKAKLTLSWGEDRKKESHLQLVNN